MRTTSIEIRCKLFFFSFFIFILLFSLTYATVSIPLYPGDTTTFNITLQNTESSSTALRVYLNSSSPDNLDCEFDGNVREQDITIPAASKYILKVFAHVFGGSYAGSYNCMFGYTVPSTVINNTQTVEHIVYQTTPVEKIVYQNRTVAVPVPFENTTRIDEMNATISALNKTIGELNRTVTETKTSVLDMSFMLLGKVFVIFLCGLCIYLAYFFYRKRKVSKKDKIL